MAVLESSKTEGNGDGTAEGFVDPLKKEAFCLQFFKGHKHWGERPT